MHHSPSRRRPWVVFAMLAVACGGSSAPPSSSAVAGKGASRLTMEEKNGKHEVAGPAFARLDTGTKTLAVYVFRAATDPAPSCELLSAPETMKRGGFIAFSVAAFAGAPGNFKAEQVTVMLGDPDEGELTLISSPLAATSVAVRSYEKDAFSGDVTSTGDVPKLAGAASGRTCPSIETSPPAATGADAEPPPAKADKPPPVVPKLDTDGVAGITIGMSVKKLPKGTSKKAPVPEQAKGITVYDAKGVPFMGEPIVSAEIVVVSATVAQMAANIAHCDAVLAKVKGRYGEGGTTPLNGLVWRGKKTELAFVPFQGDTCLVTYAKIPPKPTKPGAL